MEESGKDMLQLAWRSTAAGRARLAAGLADLPFGMDDKVAARRLANSIMPWSAEYGSIVTGVSWSPAKVATALAASALVTKMA